VVASWYRKLAERAPDEATRDSRRRTAEFLEIGATHTERAFIGPTMPGPHHAHRKIKVSFYMNDPKCVPYTTEIEYDTGAKTSSATPESSIFVSNFIDAPRLTTTLSTLSGGAGHYIVVKKRIRHFRIKIKNVKRDMIVIFFGRLMDAEGRGKILGDI